MPKLLVFGIALVGLGLLLANTALVAWFIIRKRIKGNLLFILLEVIFYGVLYFCPLLTSLLNLKNCSEANNLMHFLCTHISSRWFCSALEPSVPNSKSAAIEMYAPSSYNDTVTGETLSSVSDKSDSYSNDGSQPDLTVSVF